MSGVCKYCGFVSSDEGMVDHAGSCPALDNQPDSGEPSEILEIKSCAHCGCKPSMIFETIGPNHKHHIVGWECVSCHANISTTCTQDMTAYNLFQMGQQWNKRSEFKEDSSYHYTGENARAFDRQSKPCCKATLAIILEHALSKIEECPVCGTPV